MSSYYVHSVLTSNKLPGRPLKSKNLEMLVFLKYNLRAIDYNFDLLQSVPHDSELPNDVLLVPEPHSSDDHESSLLASASDTDTDDSNSDSDEMESISEEED